MKHPAKYLAALERERTDTSWKTFHPAYRPKEMTVREQKLWFDAGRFAAGDRDREAKYANSMVKKMVGQ